MATALLLEEKRIYSLLNDGRYIFKRIQPQKQTKKTEQHRQEGLDVA